MNKTENLYCIPHSKEIQTRKNGISYQCTRNVKTSFDIVHNNKMCHECKKEFKDNRSLKIHQTKMNHKPNVNKKRQNSPPIYGVQDKKKLSRDN